MITDLPDLDPAAVLTASETLVAAQREQAVDDLRLAQAWADLHCTDPGEPRVLGADQLIQVGGDGTPLVQELCWGELAIARHAGVIATHHLAADALDLRHRLPRLWAAVQDLRLPVWVARKVASLSRQLSKEDVVVVDVAVAAAADQSPSRIITLAEAKVIEADLDAHRARLAADASQVGVRTSKPRPGQTLDPLDGEPATLRMTLKLPPGTALGFGETVEEVTDHLFDQLSLEEREQVTRGELQAKAVELLANPAAAAALLHTAREGAAEPVVLAKPKRSPAVVHVHITDAVLARETDGVARVESLGPMLLEQLAELLHHRHITLAPVIDLRQTASVNGYEHPTRVKQRTLLRMLGDAFPHSTNLGYRRLDHDHATPYVPPDDGGPPGQTGDHNDQPLTRRHHRIKTHAPGYHVTQLALGTYRWTTPHGLGRLVTPTGTRPITPIKNNNGEIIGEIYNPRPTDVHLDLAPDFDASG